MKASIDASFSGKAVLLFFCVIVMLWHSLASPIWQDQKFWTRAAPRPSYLIS